MMTMISKLQKEMRDANLKIKALTQIVTRQQESIKTLEGELSKLKKQGKKKPVRKVSADRTCPLCETVHGSGCVYCPTCDSRTEIII